MELSIGTSPINSVSPIPIICTRMCFKGEHIQSSVHRFRWPMQANPRNAAKGDSWFQPSNNAVQNESSVTSGWYTSRLIIPLVQNYFTKKWSTRNLHVALPTFLFTPSDKIGLSIKASSHLWKNSQELRAAAKIAKPRWRVEAFFWIPTEGVLSRRMLNRKMWGILWKTYGF